MRISPAHILPLFGLLSNLAGGSEATFSADGNTLWAISREFDSLLAFNPGKPGAAPKITMLPDALVKNEGSAQILADGKGLLITADGKLWRWNPASPDSKPVLLAPLPLSFYPNGLAFAKGEALKGMIVLSGFHSFDSEKPHPKDVDESATLYGLKSGEKVFKPVFVRRVERVTACPFFADGRMIFGGNHDLWEGGIGMEDDMEDRAGTLWGYRTAPIALANTDSANSGGMSVREAVFANGTVWAALGGRHMGAIVSLPLAKKPAAEEAPELAEAWKVQRELLALAKIHRLPADEGEEASDIVDGIDALCTWSGEDGAWKIAFRSDHSKFWLMEKDLKEPQKIGVEVPAKEEH